MSPENQPYPYEPEFSLKKLFQDRWADVKYVLQFRTQFILVLIAGALLATLKVWLTKPTYSAKLTFVVDESNSSGGMGGLSALAGEFGINLGGLNGVSGVLAGDNIEQLIKSQKLIKATLTSAYDSTQTLADKYAEIYKLNDKWLKYSTNGKIIRFPLNGVHNTLIQDSLLHEMTTLILENSQFEIAKPDKKLGFFEVNTTMRDEKLALLFCDRMIKQSTDFYIETKTKRIRNNVARLQKRADSINAVLNSKTFAVSKANQTLLDINPAYTSANADVEVKDRDKVLLSTVFSETVKSLEGSKTLLIQETPTVQIVDEPELPLKKIRTKYPVAIITGILVAGLIFGLFKVLTRKKDQNLKVIPNSP